MDGWMDAADDVYVCPSMISIFLRQNAPTALAATEVLQLADTIMM